MTRYPIAHAWYLLLALLVALPSACAPSAQGLSKSLSFNAMVFNKGVRWRQHQRVAKLLHPSIRETYQNHAEAADESIQVSEVEPLRMTVQPKKRRAVIRYRYVWHRVDQGIVQKTVVIQTWQQAKDQWFVTKIAHGSGPPFPLFEGLAKKKSPRARPKPHPPRRKAPQRPAARRAAPRR